jgi:hypothetical protein
VDDDPEQLLVGPHGNLLITPEGAAAQAASNDSLIANVRQ